MTETNDIRPEFAGLAAQAAALESADTATAGPAPEPTAPTSESIALAHLALYVSGVLLTMSFHSDHWNFLPYEKEIMAPPWARIIDIYLGDAALSPWAAVILATVPVLAIKYRQQMDIDHAKRANPASVLQPAPDQQSDDGAPSFTPAAAAFQ